MRSAVVGIILTAALSEPGVFAQTPRDGQQAIRKAFDGAIAAVKRGDVETYLAFFANDAVLADMTAGQPPVIGKKALRPWITDFVSKYTFDWSDYKSEEIVTVGDLAFHRYTGTASFAPKSGGDVVRLQRRYIDSLRRDSRGQWRVWHHTWTSLCN